MNKLLIGGSVAILGLIGKLFVDSHKEEKAQKETNEREIEQRNIEIEAREAREAIRMEDERMKGEQRRMEHEQEMMEIKAIIEDAIQAETDCLQLFAKITTSSNNAIKGYRIIRHIRMVSVTDEQYKSVAERKFLIAVETAGANGVINMQVRPHRGGYFSVQGDAVLIEPV